MKSVATSDDRGRARSSRTRGRARPANTKRPRARAPRSRRSRATPAGTGLSRSDPWPHDRPDHEPAAPANGAGRRAPRGRTARAGLPPFAELRNVAPWNAKRSTSATPANTVYGLKRSARLPAKSPSELIGTPATRFDEPDAPEERRAELATVFAQAQVARQRGLSLFVRHSNEQTRTMRQHEDRAGTRCRSPRTSSRTRRGTRRTSRHRRRRATPRSRPRRARSSRSSVPCSSSSRGTNGSSIPTPKSNPSSTKYPAQRTAIRTEPEGLEIHQYVAAGSANSSPSPPTSGGSRRA